MSKLQVSSVIPGSVASGKVIVVASTRATKGKTIPAADKQRVIEIPELNASAVPDKFRKVLLASLYEAARQQLRELWEETHSMTEVDEELFTLDGLLVYAERAAESRRLTTANITEALEEFLETIENEKGRERVSKICCSMAGAVRTGTEKECFKLSSLLSTYLQEYGGDEDWTLRAVQRRVHERALELKAQREAYENESADSF